MNLENKYLSKSRNHGSVRLFAKG
jgi:hypothetical protein